MVDAPVVTAESLLADAAKPVAAKLKQYWNMIKPESVTELPKNEQFTQMAEGLLKNGKALLGDKPIISLETLNGLEPTKKKQLAAFGFDIDSLNALRDEDKRKQLATAINKGAEESQSVWNSIVHFFSGLMSWMGSGFTGGFEGLWKAVGEAASDTVSTNVKAQINANTNLKPLLPYLDDIDRTVRSRTMEVVTGKAAEQGNKGLEAVAPLPAGGNDAVKTHVTSMVESAITTQMQVTPPALAKAFPEVKNQNLIKDTVADLVRDMSLKRTDNNGKIIPINGKDKGPFDADDFKKELLSRLQKIQVIGKDGKQKSLEEHYKEWNTPAFISGVKGGLAEHITEMVGEQMQLNGSLRLINQARNLADNNFPVHIQQILGKPLAKNNFSDLVPADDKAKRFKSEDASELPTGSQTVSTKKFVTGAQALS